MKERVRRRTWCPHGCGYTVKYSPDNRRYECLDPKHVFAMTRKELKDLVDAQHREEL